MKSPLWARWTHEELEGNVLKKGRFNSAYVPHFLAQVQQTWGYMASWQDFYTRYTNFQFLLEGWKKD